MPRDYYEVLGVPRNAAADQIRSAYRKLARKFHPDVNKAKDAPEKFKEATAAYEVLSDPQKRQTYDQFGHAGPGAGAGPFGGRPGAGGRGGPRVYTWSGRGGQQVPPDFEDVFASSPFAGMSLEELLGSLGGGRRPWGRRRGQPAPEESQGVGPDQEYPLTLDFLQAVNGSVLPLELRQPDGSTERINVKIPPGVHEGSRIRVRGKGAGGPGAPGDLYILVHVRDHPYFRRQNDDIYLDLPVSLYEAALGAQVAVPTLDGQARLKVPPGSSSGVRLRLKGRGVANARGGGRGDQYVVIKIVLPPGFSDQGKKLLGELAGGDPYNPREGLPW
jgi:DnaJ-class molecular chaperone